MGKSPWEIQSYPSTYSDTAYVRGYNTMAEYITPTEVTHGLSYLYADDDQVREILKNENDIAEVIRRIENYTEWRKMQDRIKEKELERLDKILADEAGTGYEYYEQQKDSTGYFTGRTSSSKSKTP